MKFKRLHRINHKKLKYIKMECFKLQIRFILYSLWSKGIIFYFLNQLYLTKKIIPSVSIRNFCVETGRSRNLQSKFWVSRIQLKSLTSCRLITGLKKASW